MQMTSTLGRRLGLSFVCLALAGCTAGTEKSEPLLRRPVSGSVNLDGKPLAQGKIQFSPADPDGKTAPAVGEIKEGKYAIPEDEGPTPGKYKVSVSSLPPIKIDTGQDPGPRPKMDPEKVAADYNTKSTLTAEITDGKVNTANFEVKSK